VPHWFGSTGETPTEILTIFSRPGERMSVRSDAAVPEPVRGRIRRRPILGGLINHYKPQPEPLIRP
jgi:hypothetical protein